MTPEQARETVKVRWDNPAARILSPRDKDGWRIPRKGTASREIYGFAKAGMQPSEIAFHLGMKANSVRVLLHKICNPKTKS